MAYRYLWTPLALGPVTVRNRIVFSAHLTNYARDGQPTEQHAAYYARPRRGRRRADHHRGALDPPDRLALREADPRLPPRRDPRLPAHHRRRAPPPHADLRPDQPQRRPGHRRCTRAGRCGRRRRSPTRCSARCPRPSTRPRSTRSSPATPLVAEHCAEGGFDGIELQCCHSSIVRGFLSPATNRRTDDYGGTLDQPGPPAARDRRRRAPASSAAGLALGVRICGDELIEGGTTIDDAVEIARAGRGQRAGRLHQHLDRRGHGQPLHDRGVHAHPARATRCSSRRRCARRSTCRWSASGASRIRCRPSEHWPRATATWSASCAARSPTPTSRPRPGPGPPTTSACACRATRSASAGWGSTAGSAASRTRGPGREAEGVGLPRTPAPTRLRQRVMVVGAGPAGLQAAIAAARNGHDVTVLREGAAGGRAGAPGRSGAQPGRAR